MISFIRGELVSLECRQELHRPLTSIKSHLRDVSLYVIDKHQDTCDQVDAMATHQANDVPALPPAAVPEIDMPYDCDVYEPAEDTYLFLDALQDELPFLTALDPAICLEIGCVRSSCCMVMRLSVHACI